MDRQQLTKERGDDIFNGTSSTRRKPALCLKYSDGCTPQCSSYPLPSGETQKLGRNQKYQGSSVHNRQSPTVLICFGGGCCEEDLLPSLSKASAGLKSEQNKHHHPNGHGQNAANQVWTMMGKAFGAEK